MSEQLPDLKEMHWDIAKLLELGVDEKFLVETNITPEQARDLVKGLLYLRGRFRRTRNSCFQSTKATNDPA